MEEVTFQVHDLLGALVDAETFSLPGSARKAEIIDHFVQNTKQKWGNLTAKEFIEAHPKGVRTFLFVNPDNCTSEAHVERFDEGVTLHEVWKEDLSVREESKKSKPLLLAFALCENQDTTQNIAKWKKQRVEFLAALEEPSRNLSNEMLIEMIAFPFSSNNPFDDLASDGEEDIEAQRLQWDKDIPEGIDKKLCAWALHSQDHQNQILSLFSDEKLPKLLGKMKNGDWDGFVLHKLFRCPVRGDHGGWLTSSHQPWTCLFSEVVDPVTLLKFLTNVRLAGVRFWFYKEIPLHWLKQAHLQDPQVFTKEPFNRLPREMTDVVLHTKLPDILPFTDEQIASLSESEIEERVATYTGLNIKILHRLLSPNGASETGFLKKGDRLGAVIKQDAATLVELKVSRKVLAQRLEDVMALGNHNERMGPSSDLDLPSYPGIDFDRGKMQVSCSRCCGFQTDPFHPSFMWGSKHSGSDFTVDCDGETIRFPGLLPRLIKRLCFFESTYYRLDPVAAVHLLTKNKERIEHLMSLEKS